MHKATSTHSEYVILIAFPLQQWLHEHTSMLRYHTLLVLFSFNFFFFFYMLIDWCTGLSLALQFPI